MIDLTITEKIASAATPGPWYSPYGATVYSGEHHVATTYDGEYIENTNHDKDAAHITHCNPAFVLEMCKEMRRLRKELEDQQSYCLGVAESAGGEEIKRLREFAEQVAQWDGDKVSIIPSIALKSYAKLARQALKGTP